MNTDYYRVFLAVARCRSFTRAAEELYTSQPALTRTIKNLESELGVKLFVRSKKGVALTPEGQVLYEHVDAAFSLIEKAEGEIASSASFDKGSVTIGTTITALDELLFDFIESFRSAHPGIRIKINTQSSDKSVASLRQGLVDVAFVTTPFKSFPDVRITELKPFENIVVCGPEFKELRTGSHTLEELSHYPFVYLSTAMQLREYTDSVFAEEGARIQPLIELDTAAMILPMVAKNLGVSIVPKSLAKDYLSRGDVHEVSLLKPLPSRSVVMVESDAFPHGGATKRFLTAVKESLAE